jgi:hypothetical protein
MLQQKISLLLRWQESFDEDSPEPVSISHSEAPRLSPVLLYCYSRVPLTVFIDACRRGEPLLESCGRIGG